VDATRPLRVLRTDALADQTRGDGLFVYVQATTIAMYSHGDPPLPLAKTPALEGSPLRTLRMELSLCGSYGVRLNLICGSTNHAIAIIRA
jgi:hypothetical protein